MAGLHKLREKIQRVKFAIGLARAFVSGKGEPMFKNLAGFKTVVLNGVVLGLSVAAYFGVALPGVDAAAVAAGVVAAVNFINRFFTNGPVFTRVS
jgi:hypothetical protein